MSAYHILTQSNLHFLSNHSSVSKGHANVKPVGRKPHKLLAKAQYRYPNARPSHQQTEIILEAQLVGTSSFYDKLSSKY